MGKFFEALKAGAAGFVDGMNETVEPREYVIAARTVKCPHCGQTKFFDGEAMVAPRGQSNIEWRSYRATVLVCAECGRIEWFGQTTETTIDLSTIRDLD